jgi:hypothetical protein
MTVTTTDSIAAIRTPSGRSFNPSDLAPLTAAAVFPVEFTGFGFLFAGLRPRKQVDTRKMRLMTILLVTLAILGVTGCGYTNPAFKSYTINITGTSVSSAIPAQSTSVVLSVGN